MYLLEVVVTSTVFEGVGSDNSEVVNYDRNLCLLLRRTSDMVTRIDICFDGVGRVNRVILG